MQDAQKIREFLVELLSAREPEFGARLKQRLTVLCLERGFGTFNERDHGYARFSEYLRGAHADLVSIERQNQPGDILVSLISATSTIQEAPPSTQVGSQRWIRNELWQAFLNPDPKRRRFLNRTTGHVSHFLEDGSENATKARITATLPGSVEITPVDAPTQHRWMREYVESIQLDPERLAEIQAVIGSPFSSRLNTSFAKVLGEHGLGWKTFRFKKVETHIQAWAAEHSIARDEIFVFSFGRKVQAEAAPADESALTSRQTAVKLLELISNEDIERLVLPTLLASISVRSLKR